MCKCGACSARSTRKLWRVQRVRKGRTVGVPICGITCYPELNIKSRFEIKYFDCCFVNSCVFEPWNVCCEIGGVILYS